MIQENVNSDLLHNESGNEKEVSQYDFSGEGGESDQCVCPVQLMNVNETVEENVSVGPLGLCMYCNINQHSLPASRVSRALV